MGTRELDMAEVGIREFKEKASEILREVREKGETYTITYQGRPCGLLVPYPAASPTKKGRSKSRRGKVVSLWGIWKDGPQISWEEFMQAKKVWTAHVDNLAEELLEAKTGEQAENG